MVYTANQQLRIFGDRQYLDHLYYSPYLWGRLSGAYGLNPLRIWPSEGSPPTLFLGAPSNGYTDDLVEQDWQDVQEFLFPNCWTEPEGFIADAAPDAISLVKSYVQEKWRTEPHIRIVFCGVVSDSGNVWEFADGSVVPFSQFANSIEGRAAPLILDVISATPNAGDWSEKIKAFNAKNAPSKVINLYVPDSTGVPTPVVSAPAPSFADAAKAADAANAINAANAAAAADDAAFAALAAEKFAAKAEAAKPSAEAIAAGAEHAKEKLANDLLVEKAKMNVLWAGVRTKLKQRCEDKKLRAEKYELLRKNKYWYDWPYYRHCDWDSLPYHPTYGNYFYPWNTRPGMFVPPHPFAGVHGWVTK